jgi:hypothetical protein
MILHHNKEIVVGFSERDDDYLRVRIKLLSPRVKGTITRPRQLSTAICVTL